MLIAMLRVGMMMMKVRMIAQPSEHKDSCQPAPSMTDISCFADQGSLHDARLR